MEAHRRDSCRNERMGPRSIYGNFNPDSLPLTEKVSVVVSYTTFTVGCSRAVFHIGNQVVDCRNARLAQPPLIKKQGRAKNNQARGNQFSFKDPYRIDLTRRNEGDD